MSNRASFSETPPSWTRWAAAALNAGKPRARFVMAFATSSMPCMTWPEPKPGTSAAAVMTVGAVAWLVGFGRVVRSPIRCAALVRRGVIRCARAPLAATVAGAPASAHASVPSARASTGASSGSSSAPTPPSSEATASSGSSSGSSSAPTPASALASAPPSFENAARAAAKRASASVTTWARVSVSASMRPMEATSASASSTSATVGASSANSSEPRLRAALSAFRSALFDICAKSMMGPLYTHWSGLDEVQIGRGSS